MVQKIHPWGVIWVPSSRLMWAGQLKKSWQQFRPYIKKSMDKLTFFQAFDENFVKESGDRFIMNKLKRRKKNSDWTKDNVT